jgi:hypothetical protein
VSPAARGPGLHEVLARVRAQINGSIAKTGENRSQRYSFVEATQVAREFLEATAGELTMLPIRTSIVDVRPSASEKQIVFTVHTVWRITHVQSGESIDVESIGQGADNADKGAPKAQTNAMKYAVLMVLQAVGDDPEADEETDRRESGGDRPRRTRRTRESSREQREHETPLASTALKRKVRAVAREAGLGDRGLKALAHNATGKQSSTEWTEHDADKVLSRLEKTDVVDAFRIFDEEKEDQEDRP